MITRKLMGLAALPLAGLLAGGGVAMAQTSGAPANTQVAQQVTAQHDRQQTQTQAQAQQREMLRDGTNCDGQQTRQQTQAQDQTQSRDRDRDGTNCGNQQAQAATAGDRLMQQARDGSCLEN